MKVGSKLKKRKDKKKKSISLPLSLYLSHCLYFILAVSCVTKHWCSRLPWQQQLPLPACTSSRAPPPSESGSRVEQQTGERQSGGKTLRRTPPVCLSISACLSVSLPVCLSSPLVLCRQTDSNQEVRHWDTHHLSVSLSLPVCLSLSVSSSVSGSLQTDGQQSGGKTLRHTPPVCLFVSQPVSKPSAAAAWLAVFLWRWVVMVMSLQTRRMAMFILENFFVLLSMLTDSSSPPPLII